MSEIIFNDDYICPFCNHELQLDLSSDYYCLYCNSLFTDSELYDYYYDSHICWINWYKLYREFDGADFSIAEHRARFRKEFNELSKLWLEQQHFSTNDFATIWCEEYDNSKSIAEQYNDAYAYLGSSFDKMGINHWLYVRIRLNLDIH